MKGQTVILAGGSGGIGAALADWVASRGGIPVIGCRSNAERARSLAARIEQRHAVAAPVVVGDVLEPGVREALWAAAAGVGDLYGLVPLVGEPARVAIEDATVEDFLDSTRINFVAPMLLARDFAARVGGHDASIVLVSTMQAVGIFPGSTLYAAPKAALIHAMKILAHQWGGSARLRVNAVAPGVTTSGMAEKSVGDGKYDPFIENDVITRFGRAGDVAEAIGLLLRPDSYITGQLITVDGGLTLRK
jgi:NAD(P)-dependent dehydrogenase (short-subunit alcohol dehydrogenase family)